jgi:hypothetical protein
MVATIPCPHCAAEVPPSDGDVWSPLVCPNCQHVFDPDQFDNAGKPRKKKIVHTSTEPPPRGMSVSANPNRLLISYRWSNWVVLVFLVPVAIQWSVSVIVLWRLLLENQLNELLPITIFATVLVFIGNYYVLSVLFNNTNVLVSGSDVLVFTAPFPMPRSRKRIATGQIDQLYVLQQERRGSKGQRILSYDVVMIHDEAFYVTLVQKIPNPRFALYIEREIERYLSLEDRPIHGSYRR